uniref:uncharacterized protein LOC120329475 isoform X1 n=1 Tax=Styela clava TaxID=7725 RepID=UPI0019392D49|nr:uncharacterized protein LOC120329475 isoform X1 [Styela clava]
MAGCGQQNQQKQHNVYNINISLGNPQIQREIVQTRTTEIAAGEIGLINIPQAEEQQNAQNVEQQQNAQNVGQQQAAVIVPPVVIDEGVDALNLSSKISEALESDAIEINEDLEVQNLQTKKDREPTQSNHRPPRTQILNPQPEQTAAVPSYMTAQSLINAPKISMLQRKSSELFDQSEYEDAVPFLEELATLQTHQDFYTILKMVECFIQLGREKKAEKSIENLRNILMTSSVINAYDVRILATDLISDSAYIRAIILLRIASDMYRACSESPDDVIKGIQLCVCKTYDATESLIKSGGRSKILGVDYGIEYMTEMLDVIRAIKNADPVNKAVKEAWFCEYIGYNYSLAGEKKKSVKIRKNGYEVLEKQFGSNASKYQIYGLLLHNVGVEYYNLNEYSEAEAHYIKAIGAYEKASDYRTEAERKEDIEDSKTELRKTRAKLT